MGPLGFGFIGAGAIAKFHAQAVAASTGGRLIGVVSRRRVSAEAFAAEHGIGFASDDVNELLKQPGLDAVCITTPSALHLEPCPAGHPCRQTSDDREAPRRDGGGHGPHPA
jgi:UDP-N-acetyl-2-amino-2-deoxyglucuronate dehydrogenase